MTLPPRFSVRPAALEDADAVARIRTARHPDQPWPGEDVAFHWRQERFEHEVARWLLLGPEGEAVAHVGAVHRRWELNPPGRERWARIKLDVLPGHDRSELLGPLVAMAEHELNDADVLAVQVRESDSVLLEFFKASGYAPERLGRWSELDLRARAPHLEAIREVSRRRMAEQGITVTTLDQLRAERGDAVMRDLYEQSNLAEEDVPTTEPYYPAPFEEFLEWLNRSGLHHDRIWVAIGPDSSIMGLSMLLYPSLGPPWTDWTFTSRHARGLGVARALKAETALQALELGATVIRTENDGENAAILHLNDEFGYRVIPGEVELIKRLSR